MPAVRRHAGLYVDVVPAAALRVVLGLPANAMNHEPTKETSS